jgi:2-polyprenyl-3-methyl-5-hydroxy-6-metoxy-1,4-benzoquinol methylase
MEHIYDWSGDAQYDLVTCFEVLEHDPNEYAAASSLATYTKEDGLCLLSTPDIRFCISDSHNADRLEHVRSFTPESLKTVLSMCFEQVEVIPQPDRSLVAACRGPK